jgi:hypothetical protein
MPFDASKGQQRAACPPPRRQHRQRPAARATALSGARAAAHAQAAALRAPTQRASAAAQVPVRGPGLPSAARAASCARVRRGRAARSRSARLGLLHRCRPESTLTPVDISLFWRESARAREASAPRGAAALAHAHGGARARAVRHAPARVRNARLGAWHRGVTGDCAAHSRLNTALQHR